MSEDNIVQCLPDELQLATAAHVKYIKSLDTDETDPTYFLTDHLRLNGVYWGLTALHLLGHPEALDRKETIDFVLSCLHPDGGFAANRGHDSHMLYTVSAVQILTMVDGLDELDALRVGDGGGKHVVAHYIADLQNRKTGAFAGDQWGEEDTRFLYGALNALSLLGHLDLVDVDKAVEYVVACANFDGGYGATPGAESHAAQIFTCVGALSIAGELGRVHVDKLGRWLSERQIPGGGLNGRPEKKEDACYSWFVLSSLEMIGRTHWIDRDSLIKFIISCQDSEKGGLADRPGDMVDVWHTCFAIAGLSVLEYPGLEPVDPAYCMPKSTVRRVLGKGE